MTGADFDGKELDIGQMAIDNKIGEVKMSDYDGDYPEEVDYEDDDDLEDGCDGDCESCEIDDCQFRYDDEEDEGDDPDDDNSEWDDC